MDLNIYYEIKKSGKYEYIRTNNKMIQNYIKEAQNYYKLKYNNEGMEFIYPFKLGNMVLYILSCKTFENREVNEKVNCIKQYLEECILNDNYFTLPIFLAFVRDVLKISELKYSIQQYASKYYENIDNLNEINENNIKTKLTIYKRNNIEVDKTYICEELISFILVAIFEILNNKYKIHKCINCGKLFINNKKDTNTKYCNYISPQDKRKTCFKYRETATYQEIRKNNEIYNMHNKIYDLLNKRRSRLVNKSIKDNPYKDDKLVMECQANLESFKAWYDEKTKEHENNTLSKEQFLIMLNEKHQKYKEGRKYGSSRNNKK